MNDAATSSVATHVELTQDDGFRHSLHAWVPDGVRAVVQIVHGMAEHGRRYARLATALNAHGYAVYADDHRGHGQSIADGHEPGDMGEGMFDRAVRDEHAICRHLASEHPDKPVVLLGHSMGSFFVQRLLYEHPDDFVAAALSGSNGAPNALANAGRGVARIERLRLGAKGRSALIRALTFDDFNKRFAPNRTGFDWLSRDEAEVDAYVDDPLCGFDVTVETWIAFLDALPALTDPENLRCIPKDKPIYCFAGECDPVGGKAGVTSLVDAYRGAWLTDVEVAIYPGARHEILNETNRDEVTADLLRWLDRVTGA